MVVVVYYMYTKFYFKGVFFMERYSRRNHAQRHYRVARREAAVSPNSQIIKIKKNWPKIAAIAVGGLILVCLKWFFIGYLVGNRHE